MKALMKQIALVVLLLTPGFSWSQVDVNLTLNHTMDGLDFQYGNVYSINGTAVELTRVQYYLSGFELTHDGGQVTGMPDAYVLASGNISSYSLGQANVTSVEGISFDLGVDSTRNSMGTSFWPAGHPLASQAPTMDWGWPGGYFLWSIDGLVDGNNDGVPNEAFQLHGIGLHLLENVDPLTGMNASGSTINIEAYVNIAGWLKDIALRNVGAAHDGGQYNQTVSDNTNPYSVFTTNNVLGSEELEAQQSSIYADYTVPYAPTIYYDLATQDNVEIVVTNAAGQVVLRAEDQPSSGNFFVRKELPDGVYIIALINKSETKTFRFMVKN